MASSFDRWEKDPFFSAAEEVQDSADRMESAYRTLIHGMKDSSGLWNCDELRRDLRTALGTTKWQLEEFERAVESSYIKSSSEDEKERHHEFIIAIEEQIVKIENTLRESPTPEGKTLPQWVHLDEGERDELALFLSGPSPSRDANITKTADLENLHLQLTENKPVLDCSKVSQSSTEEEKPHGHRRTASASADIGTWKIAISDGDHQQSSFNGEAQQRVRKIPSFSCFLSSVQSASKLKLSKNGFRKLKAMNLNQEAGSALPQSTQLTRGMNLGYEKSKSCLDTSDDCYDKQLYGWYGSIQRQLQRSQYQMQYSRSVQLICWMVLLLLVLWQCNWCKKPFSPTTCNFISEKRCLRSIHVVS